MFYSFCYFTKLTSKQKLTVKSKSENYFWENSKIRAGRRQNSSKMHQRRSQEEREKQMLTKMFQAKKKENLQDVPDLTISPLGLPRDSLGDA